MLTCTPSVAGAVDSGEDFEDALQALVDSGEQEDVDALELAQSWPMRWTRPMKPYSTVMLVQWDATVPLAERDALGRRHGWPNTYVGVVTPSVLARYQSHSYRFEVCPSHPRLVGRREQV